MKDLGLITRVGPVTSRPVKGVPATDVPFLIEVERGNGPESLSLSPSAAADLRAELVLYLRKYGSE